MFDVIEDPRSGNAIRHPFGPILFIALNLLKTETAKPKEPIRGKRICAALDSSCLEAIIGFRQMKVPCGRRTILFLFSRKRNTLRHG